jgi:hypothetical protein
MLSLKQDVRRFLAWQSIKEDSEDLNLDAAQNRDTDNSLHRSNETVDARIKEAYCWLLVPYIDKSVDIKTIVWDTIRISGGSEGVITKAAKKMIQNEAVITQWAPALLLMELDNVLWRDSENINIKKLWEYLATYCYLPRLSSVSVLEEAIRQGLNSTEYFAFASGYDGTRYIDLKYNQYVGVIEHSGYLVKVGAAQKQIAEEAAQRQAEEAAETGKSLSGSVPADNGGAPVVLYPPPEGSGEEEGVHNPVQHVPVVQKNTRFFMSADLDTTRINRDVQKYVEEIIQHLTSVDGAKVRVSIEVEAESSDGFTQQTVRTISENCQTLRVRDSGFEG